MSHFKHVLGKPPQCIEGHLDLILSKHQGWFTDLSSDAPIHPFFQKDIFSDIDMYDEKDSSFADHPGRDDFYDRLRPALGLASAMLEKSRDFWVVIMKAPIYWDSNSAVECLKYGSLNQGLRKFWPNVDQALSVVSQITKICHFKADDRNPDPLPVYGQTGAYYKSYLQAGRNGLKLRMALADRLFHALNDSVFRDKPLIRNCVVHINIAHTLLHELAHCLHAYVELHEDVHIIYPRRNGSIPMPPEPLVDFLPNPELGGSLEISLLGGKLWIIIPSQACSGSRKPAQELLDSSQGLALQTYSSCGRTKYYKMAESTILMLLHESAWQSSPMPIYLLSLHDA